MSPATAERATDCHPNAACLSSASRSGRSGPISTRPDDPCRVTTFTRHGTTFCTGPENSTSPDPERRRYRRPPALISFESRTRSSVEQSTVFRERRSLVQIQPGAPAPWARRSSSNSARRVGVAAHSGIPARIWLEDVRPGISHRNTSHLDPAWKSTKAWSTLAVSTPHEWITGPSRPIPAAARIWAPDECRLVLAADMQD